MILNIGGEVIIKNKGERDLKNFNPNNILLEENAYIVLTHLCNRNCPFCIDIYKNKSEDYLSLEKLKEINDILQDNKIKRVTLVGGEPLLNPKIEEICLFLSKYYELVITTNFDYYEKIIEIDKKITNIHWNFSLYDDKEINILPKQLQGDITISKLISKNSLKSKDELDEFIEKYQNLGYKIKFSTLSKVKGKELDTTVPKYIQELPLSKSFNDTVYGHFYKGCFIDRKDIIPDFSKANKKSLKIKPNGEISTSWSEE